MNGPSIPVCQFLTLTTLLILLAALPATLGANEPEYSSALPIIIASPGELFVDDEQSLRTAIELANSNGRYEVLSIDESKMRLRLPLFLVGH